MRQSWLSRFTCAFRGLAWVFLHEPSGRVHAAAIVTVAALGIGFRVTAGEWALIALACGGVVAAEALNTAVERLADRVSAEREEAIRLVKDTAAGGVLAAALGAAGTGLAIFGPRFVALLE